MHKKRNAGLGACLRLLLSWWFIALCGPALAQQATAPSPIQIGPQALEPALKELAEKQNLQILYSPGDLKGLSTRGVSGMFTAKEAAQRLVQETGLTVSFDGRRTLVVKPQAANEKGGQAANPTLLAQAQSAERQPVASQDRREPAVRGESITVTAQKREEQLQDVPISMSVLRGVELDKSTAQGITEALNRVPGVAAPLSFGVLGTGPQVIIRGVSAAEPLFSGASPTAYYIDSIPFGTVKSAIVPDFNVYDLQRVEVLRGPQGTLYGANSLNGVVRVLTHDADLERLDFKARTLASSTEGGTWNYRGDAAINVPIVPGRLAVRGVVGFQDLGGWIDTPSKENVNDAEISNIRLKVSAQPTDKLSMNVLAWRSRSDIGAPSISADRDGLHFATLDEPATSDFDAYGARISYKFPSFTFSSSTSYLDYATSGVFDLAILGLTNRTLDTTLDAKVFAQEVLFNSQHAGPWRWSFGGMYRDAEDTLDQFIATVTPAHGRQTESSKSSAVFGEVTRSLFDGDLEITAGLRYFEDKVGLRQISAANGGPILVPGVESKFDQISPRVTFTWYPNRQTTIYTSYAEGFRSGGFNSPLVVSINPNLATFGPDTLRNYELGTKGSAWDERLSFDAAVYYLDWRGQQQPVSLQISPVQIGLAIVNSEAVSGPGFEFGLRAKPIDAVTLGANFGWNDLKLDADIVSGGIVLFRKGERPSFSAKTTAGAFVDYSFPLGTAGLKGRFSASANYASRLDFRRLEGTIVRFASGDSMLIGRTSLSVASRRWEATVFVDNVTNEQGAAIRAPGTADHVRNRPRPRTVGVQLEYVF